jgi:hypothetical protein
MFAGHVGAALIVGRAERRVSLAWLVAAALLLDVVLWVLILIGAESVEIPADFAHHHQPVFDFPWSHGLVAALGWSVLAAVVAAGVVRTWRWRGAIAVAAAVASHWILDALVHRPELPLGLSGERAVGFGLWDRPVWGLGLEVAVVVAGLLLWLPGSQLSRARGATLVLVVGLVTGSTLLGMTVAPAPPSATAMAASSLGLIALVVALIAWLTREA